VPFDRGHHSVENFGEEPVGPAGVLSHQSLFSILGVAEQTGSRCAILREAIDVFFMLRRVF
jgi:hypothetical protein